MRNYINFINENKTEYIETTIYTVDEHTEKYNHSFDILEFDRNEIDISNLTTEYPDESSSITINTHKLKIDIDDFLEYNKYDTLKKYITDEGEINNEKLKDFIDNNAYGDYIDDSEYESVDFKDLNIILINSAEYEMLEEIEKSIDFGKNINSQNFSKNTPLIIASFYGYSKIVDYLIEKGADLDKQNDSNDTALTTALNENEFEIAKTLINNDANVDLSNHSNKTPLIIASEKNNLEMVKLILKKIPKINTVDDDGFNAIFYAVYNNNLEMVKLLFEHNGDLNIEDDLGYTIFDHVFEDDNKDENNTELIKFLVEQGINFKFDDIEDEEYRERVAKIFPKKYEEYLLNQDMEKFNI